MDINELSYRIRGVFFEVHRTLGPGLFESVYEAAIIYELDRIKLRYESQVPIPAFYKEAKLDVAFRADIIVEDSVIIEIKSVGELGDVHKKQLLTYLRLSKKKLGLLVNFNSRSLIDKVSLIRIIN